tara:strand:- start:96 stop:215 length:120 start_codon:yes stop_codon:yes gene_type:complete
MLEELQDSDHAIFEKVRIQLVEGTTGESAEPAGGDDDDE